MIIVITIFIIIVISEKGRHLEEILRHCHFVLHFSSCLHIAMSSNNFSAQQFLIHGISVPDILDSRPMLRNITNPEHSKAMNNKRFQNSVAVEFRSITYPWRAEAL
jgi:predicted SAM-dependent methyltransferase